MSEPLPPILIVDDEKNMRRSLETMLGDEGYETRCRRIRRGGAGPARRTAPSSWSSPMPAWAE